VRVGQGLVGIERYRGKGVSGVGVEKTEYQNMLVWIGLRKAERGKSTIRNSQNSC